MGHTVASQRIVIDNMLKEMKSYADALRHDEREDYIRMLNTPLKKVGAISSASSVDTWAFMLLTILLEHEKKLQEITISADSREQKNC